MALYKLHDFDPNYKDHFNGDDIKGLDVYSQNQDEKIGSIHDALVDESGQFRYLIVDTGFWVFGKKVMLPVGLSRIDYNNHRVYVNMSKEQAENLPEFNEDLKLDRDYETRVRNVYQPSASTRTDASDISVNTAPLDANSTAAMSAAGAATPMASADRSTYDMGDRTNYNDIDNNIDYMDADVDDYYRQDPFMYNMNERDHGTLRLYQERLIANKQRQKTGEVAIGKHVETETQRVSVPVEKERVVIERTTPGNAAMGAADMSDFNEGEVARVDVYEEVADVRKEAFVREEVQIRKEVNQETVDAEETLRREELDIDTSGNPVVDRRV